MDIYIFRHGQTYFSKRDIPYGDKVRSAEILPEGIVPVNKLANYLKSIDTDVNLTSPFLRCIQTTKIVSEKTKKVFTVDESLRDWDPQTESVEDMIVRVYDFCERLEFQKRKSAAICTHGYPINSIIAYFTKGTIHKSDLDNFPKCGVLVSIINGKVDYKDFN